MPNNKNQGPVGVGEEDLPDSAPDSPTIFSARAMVEQLPNLSAAQICFFEKELRKYCASGRGRRDQATFFARIRPESLMAIKPSLDFVEHEDHGVKKHVGGKQSGTRWLIDGKQKTKKLEEAIENFLTENYADLFSKKVLSGEIISFDIIGDIADLRLGLKKESFDYFKLQVTVWRDDEDDLKVSYHGYPYQSASLSDLGAKVVKSERMLDSQNMSFSSLGKGSFG